MQIYLYRSTGSSSNLPALLFVPKIRDGEGGGRYKGIHSREEKFSGLINRRILGDSHLTREVISPIVTLLDKLVKHLSFVLFFGNNFYKNCNLR